MVLIDPTCVFGLHSNHAEFMSFIKYVDAIVGDVPFCVWTVVPYFKATFHMH